MASNIDDVPLCKVCGKSRGRYEGFCKVHHPGMIEERKKAKKDHALWAEIEKIRVNGLVPDKSGIAWLSSKVSRDKLSNAIRAERYEGKRVTVTIEIED